MTDRLVREGLDLGIDAPDIKYPIILSLYHKSMVWYKKVKYTKCFLKGNHTCKTFQQTKKKEENTDPTAPKPDIFFLR